jgi:hypothetical protein
MTAVSAGGRSTFAVFAADYWMGMPAGFLNPGIFTSIKN